MLRGSSPVNSPFQEHFTNFGPLQTLQQKHQHLLNDLNRDKNTHTHFTCCRKGTWQQSLSQLHEGEKPQRAADAACSSQGRVKMWSWHRPASARSSVNRDVDTAPRALSTQWDKQSEIRCVCVCLCVCAFSSNLEQDALYFLCFCCFPYCDKFESLQNSWYVAHKD